MAVNRELETLRHRLNKAIEWGMLEENPFSKSKNSILFEEKNERVRYLTEGEIKKLLSASPFYLKNIIKAALLTGLRKGDILSLKWCDIDLEKGILFFREQKKRSRPDSCKKGESDLQKGLILFGDPFISVTESDLTPGEVPHHPNPPPPRGEGRVGEDNQVSFLCNVKVD